MIIMPVRPFPALQWIATTPSGSFNRNKTMSTQHSNMSLTGQGLWSLKGKIAREYLENLSFE